MQRKGFKTVLPQTEEGKAIISDLMASTIRSFRKPKVTSDDELMERITEYFKECVESGQMPTIEEMQLQCGYNYRWFWDVEHGRRTSGFSPQTKEIVADAKEAIRTFDAKLVMNGMVNPIVYIFRAKNYYGMRDQQDVNINANVTSKDMTPEDIARKYGDDTFVEGELVDEDTGN